MSEQSPNGKRVVSDASTVTGISPEQTPLHQLRAAPFIGWGLGLTVGSLVVSTLVSDNVGFSQFLVWLAVFGTVLFAVGLHRLAAKADAAFARHGAAGPPTPTETPPEPT